MDSGFYSKLKVTIPPVTIPSWPCLFSGLTPYQLGFWYFSNPEKGIFNSNFWKDNAIFSNPVIKSFVLNIPGTYPAWKINGIMVTGLMSPKMSCYPEELESEYSKRLFFGEHDPKKIFKAFETKKNLFLEKLKEDYELLIYVIRIPDAMSHMPHKSPDEISEFISLGYQKIDKFLGKILKTQKFDNLFIVSDHGLNMYKKVFYLQTWLIKNGFLRNNDMESSTIWMNLLLKFYGYFSSILKSNRSLINVFEKLSKLFFNPKNVEMKKNIMAKPIDAPRYKTNNYLLQSFKSNIGAIFLDDQISKIKDKIKEKLKLESCVKKVICPNFLNFPDIYVILKDEYYCNVTPSISKKRKTKLLTHSQEGIFFAYGKNIRNGTMEKVNFYDIVPTLNKLYGISKVDNELIGKPLDILKDL